MAKKGKIDEAASPASPAQGAKGSPPEIPEESPAQGAKGSPPEIPEESPAESLSASLSEPQSEAPAESPSEAQAESPSEAPAESPPEAPAVSPAKRAPAATTAKKAPAAAEVEELPRAIVRRLVKEQLSQLSAGTEGGAEDLTIQKDALLAFGGSARVFIHYLSSTANVVCKESQRQTINAEDVLKALEDINFPEFIEPLKASLEEFRRRNAEKKTGGQAKVTKKRKLNEQPTAESGDDADEGAAEVEQMEVEGVDA